MYYSQKDYPKVKLGTCSCSIADDGCFLTSFCNVLQELKVAQINPEYFNRKAFPAGGCMANAAYWASLYDMYYVKTTVTPRGVCIIETDHFASAGFPQHFCMWKDGMIIDPLDHDPQWKKNPYHVVSCRIFTPKVPMAQSTVDAIAEKVQPPIQVPVATPIPTPAPTPTPTPDPVPVVPVVPVAVPQPVQVTGNFPVDGSIPTEGNGTTQIDLSTPPNNYSTGSASRAAVPSWLDLIKKLFGLIFKK